MNQDRGLFLSLASILLGLGALMVYSASATSWPGENEQIYLSRHLTFLAVGTVAAIVAACLPVRFWYRYAPWLAAGTVLLLCMALMPGVGTRIHGAQRWLRYGSLTIQPSELAKITLPLVVCYCVTRRRGGQQGKIARYILPVVPIAIVIPLVARQPDLGTAVFLATGGALALWAAGWPVWCFLFGGTVTLTLGYFLFSLEPYQISRITGFLATWSDLSSAPYQLKQSLVTLGAGGIWGVGIGKGWQKLSFLPEANTDFVFSVLGEELGLVGTMSLLTLWCGLYVVGLRLLRSHRTGTFAYAVGFTLLTQLVLQAALNVAVATAMVPPKGIPHPLISYGGSNLVTSLIAIGIIVSMSRGTGEAVEADGQSIHLDPQENASQSRPMVLDALPCGSP